ncbi:MAG: hypothetical protein IPL06_11270 [Betaproteobacteria bacterium]|nr:hypothetical protein [Betaproteobacteria bacterium]
MKPPMPQLLSLAPRGVIVDEAGGYRGLAPWFDANLLAEMLRRYNEYPPYADFARAWAELPDDAPVSAGDARREAALAVSKARSLSALVPGGELEPPPVHAVRPGRRRSDREPEPDEPQAPGAEPSGPG